MKDTASVRNGSLHGSTTKPGQYGGAEGKSTNRCAYATCVQGVVAHHSNQVLGKDGRVHSTAPVKILEMVSNHNVVWTFLFVAAWVMHYNMVYHNFGTNLSKAFDAIGWRKLMKIFKLLLDGDTWSIANDIHHSVGESGEITLP